MYTSLWGWPLEIWGRDRLHHNMQMQEWTTHITSRHRLLDLDWRGLGRCKDLIFLLVHRRFVARYKQTVLGPFWAVIQPFFTTVVFSIFFGNLAGLGAEGIPNFLFYFSGNILWGLFAGCLNASAMVFLSNIHILRKVYFPRLVLPISACLSQFISFGIQFLFFMGFMAYYLFRGVSVHPTPLLLLTPVLLLHVALLGLGTGIILSSLTTKYRDLTLLVGFGVQLWSFCSPVAYDMFSRPPLQPGSRWHTLYMLNPVTPLLNAFRQAWLGCGEFSWTFYGISWVVTLCVVLLGLMLFSHIEKDVEDTI